MRSKLKVLNHLYFFLQDVSDRVEKDHPTSPALMSLESDCYKVVGTDWRLKIDQHVAEDLRRYRTYNGEHVRDLLRALRNKVRLISKLKIKFTDVHYIHFMTYGLYKRLLIR